MKIAIIGCGAIGGYVGARLGLAGEQVTFMVRGANLEALRARGVRLISSDGSEEVALEAVATDVPRLFGAHTAVVTMQNGIPYWYFHEHGGALAGTILRSVDPNGEVSRNIPAARVIGCVVYPAAELVAPGVVRVIEGDRFPVGELDGSSSERVNRIAQCLANGRLKSPVLSDIRSEIWLKLWGNLTFNPISALTRAT